jgi:hypothetical protein
MKKLCLDSAAETRSLIRSRLRATYCLSLQLDAH